MLYEVITDDFGVVDRRDDRCRERGAAQSGEQRSHAGDDRDN